MYTYFAQRRGRNNCAKNKNVTRWKFTTAKALQRGFYMIKVLESRGAALHGEKRATAQDPPLTEKLARPAAFHSFVGAVVAREAKYFYGSSSQRVFRRHFLYLGSITNIGPSLAL
jgi:hypothetical protein